jgi:3-oxoacyl-[acyl-carrier-protein] synthase II
MNPPRAVITGTGLAVPGLREAADLLAAPPPGGHGGHGGFDPTRDLDRRGWKYRDRPSRLASCAAESALGDARLVKDGEGSWTGHRVAVVVSSNFGILGNVCAAMDVITEHGSVALSPMGLPHTGANMVAGWLAIDHGLKGPNLTVCNGATSGLDAVYWARNLIAAGRADIVLVVGVEQDDPAVARLLGPDVRRLDGAAALVMESPQSAAARGVPPRAVPARFGRATNLAEAARAVAGRNVARLLAVEGLAGQGRAGEGIAWPAGLRDVPVLDIEVRLGRCSGALGVLQCAAAVAAFDHGEQRDWLATCGGAAADDAAAVLALTRAEH